MRLGDFLYDLPEDLIAQSPLDDRAASRLLVLDKRSGAVTHRTFRDVVEIFQKGDLLVMNDTRVTALRVFGRRPTGGRIEALLVEAKGAGKFVALMRPAKRLRQGEEAEFEGGLTASIEQDLGEGRRLVRFLQTDYRERLKEVGLVPLPPYVHGQIKDPERYQTVYATASGSAAAPTAGLHFTKELLDQLKDKGVETATVTLDVSLDTFRPIATDDVEDHKMHGEKCRVPEATASAIAACKGRIIAVGTTTVRTLESFATARRTVSPGEQSTKLFIRPGYDFKVVDGMLTNFHLPGTTMMLLVSALAGREQVMDTYREAVVERYRFLSFGDSMLVI